MTILEIAVKYKIPSENILAFATAFDDIYLRFTKQQALAIVSDLYDHADDLYNEVKNLD